MAITAGRTPGRPNGTYQFKFAVGTELRALLNAAAEASGVSVAEEIRRRVEKSFQPNDSGISRPASLTLVRTVRTLLRQIEDAIDATTEAENK